MSKDKYESQITEIEFKYSADDIKRKDFVGHIEALSPERELTVASWDYYYSGSGMPFEFVLS